MPAVSSVIFDGQRARGRTEAACGCREGEADTPTRKNNLTGAISVSIRIEKQHNLMSALGRLARSGTYGGFDPIEDFAEARQQRESFFGFARRRAFARSCDETRWVCWKAPPSDPRSRPSDALYPQVREQTQSPPYVWRF